MGLRGQVELAPNGNPESAISVAGLQWEYQAPMWEYHVAPGTGEPLGVRREAAGRVRCGSTSKPPGISP